MQYKSKMLDKLFCVGTAACKHTIVYLKPLLLLKLSKILSIILQFWHKNLKDILKQRNQKI